MHREVTLDFETASECDLKRAGAQRYARHPSTHILSLSYAFDDGAVKTWIPGTPPPEDLFEAVVNGAKMKAHNAGFERAIWQHLCVLRHGWPIVPFDLWRCTMAASAYRSIPLKLDVSTKVLRLAEQKGEVDTRVFRPRKPTKAEKKKWAAEHGDAPMPTLWHDEFQLLQDTYEYNAQDVRSERALDRVVGELPRGELAVWRLDQIINERGIQIDVPSAERAVALVEVLEARDNAELEKITGGIRGTQRDKFKAWLLGHGVDLPDMTSDTITEFLKPPRPGVDYVDRPDFVNRALELRQSVTRAGTKKLQAMLDCVCEDGRARGVHQYYGATTGRFAGRLIQTQNFKRPWWDEGFDVDALVEAINLGDAELLTMIYGDPVDALSHALRSYIVAAPGKLLVAGDFSAIEAVGTAAICGEERKLDVFREKKDPYLVFASKVFGVEVQKKDKPKRTVGKMGELSFGYGGSVGAWRNFEPAGPSVHTDEAILGYRDMWREEHPATYRGWYALQNAAVETVQTGQAHDWREVEYFMAEDGDWLGCRLPSGRCIWYREPRVVEAMMPWLDRHGNPVFRDQREYRAWKPAEGGWVVVRAWGGHLMENVVQAACRDLLVAALFRCEKAGIPVVMHVHDEIVGEVPEHAADPKLLEQIMEERPTWAANWPIRSEAFAGYRYRK